MWPQGLNVHHWYPTNPTYSVATSTLDTRQHCSILITHSPIQLDKPWTLKNHCPTSVFPLIHLDNRLCAVSSGSRSPLHVYPVVLLSPTASPDATGAQRRGNSSVSFTTLHDVTHANLNCSQYSKNYWMPYLVRWELIMTSTAFVKSNYKTGTAIMFSPLDKRHSQLHREERERELSLVFFEVHAGNFHAVTKLAIIDFIHLGKQ